MADKPRGERLRMALNEMGPIYVKFGQIISTRRDLVAPDIADELALLQDQVPPFPGAEAQAIVEQALQKAGLGAVSRPSTWSRWPPPPSPRCMALPCRTAAR